MLLHPRHPVHQETYIFEKCVGIKAFRCQNAPKKSATLEHYVRENNILNKQYTFHVVDKIIYWKWAERNL